MNSTSGSAATSGAVRRKRFWGALAVTALVSAVMVVSSQPTSADATKTLSAACGGADPATTNLLSQFNIPPFPITVKTTAPTFVEPGQTGIPVSLAWELSLSQDLVNTVAGISPNISISGINTDIVVEGPTSTEKIAGNPPAQSITLTPGQAFTSSFPAMNGTLNDIGNGGVIKLRSERITLKIQLASGPLTDPLNLVCTTGTTVASIPVKIAGSPDIVQPIEVPGTPGQPVTIDVLNQFVTNGVTKEGEEKQVDPSTLKIVEGDATIQNGQVVANSPAAGASSEVTFEVCAGTTVLEEADPGVSEVQILRLYEDPATFFNLGPGFEFRRALGTEFSFEGESGAALWSAAPKIGSPSAPWTPVPDLSDFQDETKTAEEVAARIDSWWANNVNNYWLQSRFRAPSATEVRNALESIPSIGAGNVEVEQLPAENAGKDDQKSLRFHPYKVTFTGDLANKSVNNIGAAKTYSFIPQLNLAALLPGGDGDGEGGEGGEGEDDKTPIPGAEGVPELEPGDPFYHPVYEEFRPIGGDVRKYLDYIDRLIQLSLIASDYVRWFELVQHQLAVTFENIIDLIDVEAATALLARIIIPPADSVVEVQGEDPTPEQIQELCSQGIITINSAGVEGISEEQPPGADVGGATENRGGAGVRVAG